MPDVVAVAGSLRKVSSTPDTFLYLLFAEYLVMDRKLNYIAATFVLVGLFMSCSQLAYVGVASPMSQKHAESTIGGQICYADNVFYCSPALGMCRGCTNDAQPECLEDEAEFIALIFGYLQCYNSYVGLSECGLPKKWHCYTREQCDIFCVLDLGIYSCAKDPETQYFIHEVWEQFSSGVYCGLT